jgi:hypothetical protein
MTKTSVISQNKADFGDFAADHDYQELCELGRMAAQNMDENRYLIGDLALQVKKQYRRDAIGGFAKDIGISKSRINEYRTVCGFWTKSARAYFSETYGGLVNYSHLRIAMRLKEPGLAFEFVRECGENAYTCEQATVKLTERLGKPTPPPKLLDGLGYVRDIRGQRVLIEVDTSILPAMYEAWQRKQPVRMVVTRSDETPDINPVVALLGSGYERRIDTRLVTKVG